MLTSSKKYSWSLPWKILPEYVPAFFFSVCMWMGPILLANGPATATTSSAQNAGSRKIIYNTNLDATYESVYTHYNDSGDTGTFHLMSSPSATFMPALSTNYPLKWTSQASASDNDWYGVAYGNGLFVAVASTGTGNRVMTSPDGITWTARTSAADNTWNDITYGGPAGGELFVAVAITGTGNRVMTSPDGITWTARTSAADNEWRSVTYGGPAGSELFVAVAYTGTNRIMTSPDGINWTIQTSPVTNGWRSVTYGGPAGSELFVAVASVGTSRVMTSPDGITWTNQTMSAGNEWWDVTYGNGLFVAVANTGTGQRVMTSSDGITWTSRASAADNGWRSVTYGGAAGNERFVAVANNGIGNRVMTSPDGITWTSGVSAANIQWRSVIYGGPAGNERFVAVASSGTGNRVMTGIEAIPELQVSDLQDISFCPGIPSNIETFSVSGANLIATVTLTAPNDFEIRKNGEANFASMITLPIDGNGTLVTTSVDIRTVASATVSMTAVISITSDTETVSQTVTATAAPPEIITVQGNNVNIFAGDDTPDTSNNTQFGVVTINKPATKTYIIQNTGGRPLVVSAITLEGADAGAFVVSGISLPATIPSNGSTSFTVSITAATSGLKSARIVITSDDNCSVISQN